MFSQRAAFKAIGEQSDPRRQVRMLADMIASVQERSAPVQAAYRQAAAVDTTVAGYLEAALQRRLETLAVAIRMIDRPSLRRPHDESAETLWAVGSSEVFLLLRTVRGWDADRYRDWLRRTLIDVLLKPSMGN